LRGYCQTQQVKVNRGFVYFFTKSACVRMNSIDLRTIMQPIAIRCAMCVLEFAEILWANEFMVDKDLIIH
jgi:hypothetical protein